MKTVETLFCVCQLAEGKEHQLRRPFSVSQRCELTSLTFSFYVHTEFPDNRRGDAVLGKWNETPWTGL